MSWCQPIPGLIKDLPGEGRGDGMAPVYPAAPASPFCSLVLQLLLHIIPDVRINDGGVLPLKDLALVPDTPRINGVGQNVMDMPPIKGTAAALSSARSNPLFSSKPHAVCHVAHRPHGAKLLIESVKRADGLCFWLKDLQGASVRLISHGNITSHPEALLLGGGDLVPNALGRHFSLKLRKAQEHVEGQPSHTGGSIEGLGNGDERGTGCIQLINDLSEVGKGAGQAIDLIDNNAIHPTFVNSKKKPLQGRALQCPT
ncbi:hypothetical protein BOA8489_04049 [Boseongicola aestuarii]|uniref:Uncharacterized protein n=1 Tax=Boseongicola aestuarii TaxID=1470561 RepID=A0A238J7P6_9RHOB|nr:hypothetical protein BOA8489_04049 [Boseongicola aestuarii]